MENDTIPSINDEAWFSQNELGKIDKVITYNTGEGTAQVRVTAHILSGAVAESIEAKHSALNEKTGEIDLNTDAYLRDIIKQVFRMNDATYRAVMDNKSADLRSKLRALATQTIGLTMDEQEIELEKNLGSPEPSTTS